MSSLLANSVQPSIISLLSSSSQPGISPVWKSKTPSDNKQAFIAMLPDNDTSIDHVDSSKVVPRHQVIGRTSHRILHIQGPDLRKTYIQAGCSFASSAKRQGSGFSHKATSASSRSIPLGIQLPWMTLQIRPLGRRELSLEIGIIDDKGREGMIRISSFKKMPSVQTEHEPPLLHLPLQAPKHSATTLTPWLHISINLNTLIPLFTELAGKDDEADSSGASDNSADNNDSSEDDVHDHPVAKRRKIAQVLPAGKVKSISYVRVYASCRLRRIWFSENGERTLEAMSSTAQAEFGLYAATAT